MSIIQKAKRSQSFLKIGVEGPSGSGKSYSSLLLAKGMMGDLSSTVVLDTENGSANLYEHLGDYSVLPFDPPYGPDRYINAINMCVKEGFKVIIIDSITHEWSGSGGCLDIHAKLGGQFQHWAKVTPMHRAFIDAILQAKAHVICTTRKKQEYALANVNGRNKVEKLGMKSETREGWEYEMTCSFEMQMNHMALAGKDRTSLFDGEVPFDMNEEVGKKLINWANGSSQTKNKGE